MKKNLFLLVLLTTSFVASTFAQSQMKDCKNPCEKQRVVNYGPFIGVRILDIPNAQGVRVIEVIPNTSAAKNGLRLNDVLTQFNGLEIVNSKQLINEVAKYQPNDLVSLSYTRDAKIYGKKINLGAQFSKTITEMVCCDEAIKTDFEMNITMSPNPATNRVTIHSSAIMNGNIDIIVLDMQGAVVSIENLKSNEGLLHFSFDISNLPAGQYLVKVKSEANQFVSKLVKTN
jgi:C-terminal processing protease CtpA/Prc